MDDQVEQNAIATYPDEIHALRSFVDCGVRFVIVGGRAVRFHGHLRPAPDLDLLVELSAENWTRLHVALKPLNASVPVYNTLSPEKRYQAKLSFYPTVELLTSIIGVSFEQAWTGALICTIDEIEMRVLSRDHLIASKLTTNRDTDLDDIRFLRAGANDGSDVGASTA